MVLGTGVVSGLCALEIIHVECIGCCRLVTRLVNSQSAWMHDASECHEVAYLSGVL